MKEQSSSKAAAHLSLLTQNLLVIPKAVVQMVKVLQCDVSLIYRTSLQQSHVSMTTNQIRTLSITKVYQLSVQIYIYIDLYLAQLSMIIHTDFGVDDRENFMDIKCCLSCF